MADRVRRLTKVFIRPEVFEAARALRKEWRQWRTSPRGLCQPGRAAPLKAVAGFVVIEPFSRQQQLTRY
jgi:hypothetical protein